MSGDEETESFVDSMFYEAKSTRNTLSQRKLNILQLINYLLFYNTSICFGHNWQIKLLHIDTIYLPNEIDQKFYYMLIDPYRDTISAQDFLFRSDFGEKKKISIKPKGKKGSVIHYPIQLPITNPITNELQTYRDTVIIKIIGG